ncbi:MAG: hypothetical protein OHK0035_35110 [Cyanobacteria bacterium J069]
MTHANPSLLRAELQTGVQTLPPAIAAVLVLPVLQAGRLGAAMWLLSHEDQRRFDAEDLRLLTSLSELLAPVLPHASPQQSTANAEPQSAQQSAQPLEQITDAMAVVFWLADATEPHMLYVNTRSTNVSRGAIALTAYAAEADTQQAIAAGFQQHLAKPIEPDALIQAIASAIPPKSGSQTAKSADPTPDP